MRITADRAFMIQIGTTLLTGVGSFVAIAKFGGGGLYWRWQGTMMDASLEARWLVEMLAASGGVVFIRTSSLAVGGRRGCTKLYARPI